MPVWPKSFYTFGVNLKTASTEWKLRKKHAAPEAQDRALAALTPPLARASHWRGLGVEAGMSYQDFKTRVPLQAYAHLAPAIESMTRGEKDVLWPGRCSLFARSAGTSGPPKYLPVTDALLAHFMQAGLDALLYYTVRVRHAGAFRGRHLLLGSPKTLVPLGPPGSAEPAKSFAGDLSGIAALSLPAWAERHFHEPAGDAGRVADWDEQIEAITAEVGARDIALIAGPPNWTLPLTQLLQARYSTHKSQITHLQAHWPNLECFVHTGMPMGPFADELRHVLGPTVAFHEIYAASECMLAAQDDKPGRGLRVMADAGIFFEFLPLSDYQENRLAELGPKAVPLAAVETGVDYAVIVTTPGGLARYVLGDVVRFTSTKPPRLNYIGRTDLRLNSYGENVSEKDVTETLVALCQQRGWRIANFHVAPLDTPKPMSRDVTGRHEWWIELKPGTAATPTGGQLAMDLDVELRRSSETYNARRKSGVLDAPVVRLVMPGIFEHWLRFARKWGGQHKTPRCGQDRPSAEELGAITNFACD